jgi:hypothetical protein
MSHYLDEGFANSSNNHLPRRNPGEFVMKFDPHQCGVIENELLLRIRAYTAAMSPEQRDKVSSKYLVWAADEIERLLRGDFTEEEFQNLCHKHTGEDAARFRQGCEEYQRKLFGSSCPH